MTIITKESIENMPVILVAGTATSNVASVVVTEYDPLSDGISTSDLATEVMEIETLPGLSSTSDALLTSTIMVIEPLSDDSSGLVTSVTQECIETTTTSEGTSRNDNNAILMDNYLLDDIECLDADDSFSLLTSVTHECIKSSAPATNSEGALCNDNCTVLTDNDLIDDIDFMNIPLVPYSEHSDSNSEEEPRKIKRRKKNW
ncbi:unnamed protein product [Parnassius apollo]|uniref:(apollo) hypothetical protein n=1 Tax=Parnassius apollo TaxID=110799 RepID=A0A8S3Y4V5_PARAO|nr:unnamed protein product [Parnassius apollo]